MRPSIQLIRDKEIEHDVATWICTDCEATFMSPSQATETVQRAVAIYQMKHGLLTAGQIRENRRR